jgi:2-dehydropantoate 2-reductase
MRIAIMAAGGVGGFLAAYLLRHGATEVALVARGAHLDALKSDGLTLTSEDDRFTVAPPLVTDDPAEIGPVDAVIFTVKLADTEAAAAACRPLLGPNTAVVPFQNGVESRERIASVIGEAHACAGCCYVSVAIERPGVIRQAGQFGRFMFAEANGAQSARMESLRQVLVNAGIEAPTPADIDVELWTKFSFLVGLSGLTAAGRTTIGTVRNEPAMAAIYRRAIEEAVAVAWARGVALPDDVVERHLEFTASLPGTMRASQAIDLERDNVLEVDWLSGAVVRLGAEHGIDTPVNATLYAALKPFAAGRQA